MGFKKYSILAVMVVAVDQLDLVFPGVNSLKEKPSLIWGRIARIGRTSNLAIAEVADHDLVGNSVIALVVVGEIQSELESQIGRVVAQFEVCPDVEVRHFGLEFRREEDWF